MADNKNMTQEEIDNGEEMTVTLTLDDGREIECVVLTIFPAGGKDYIALLPMDDIEAEDGEVYLYRYSEDENGQPNLENIEDDDEYEIVADAFDELLDEQEYDELVGEDELGSVIRQAKDRTPRYFAGRNGEASGRFTSFQGWYDGTETGVKAQTDLVPENDTIRKYSSDGADRTERVHRRDGAGKSGGGSGRAGAGERTAGRKWRAERENPQT